MHELAQEPLILVVDDTPSNLEVVSEVLIEAGFEVATALTGEQALEQVQYSQPDLILLDVMMPGINGFETCRRLKENPATSDIPVIFMTALADTGSMEKGFSLGAVDYISKPFQEKEVLAHVNVHLKLRSLSKNLEQLVVERTAALNTSLEQLKQSQLQLVQREKMSALGNLVAGIAHEINNPLGFISSNLGPAQQYVEELFDLLDLYQEQCSPSKEIQAALEGIDFAFVRDDLPKLLVSMKLGVERIRNISSSLRIFSRADNDCKVSFNLHDCIDSTLLILKHRFKGNNDRLEIEVVKEYGALPDAVGFPGQLNQVFMNLIANAIDAIDMHLEASQNDNASSTSPCIWICTEALTDPMEIVIRIKDNGIGMSDAVQQRIFEQQFTTKPVGKGTGLGLSIARHIVEEIHGGQLSCTSVAGAGTEFVIQIPQ